MVLQFNYSKVCSDLPSEQALRGSYLMKHENGLAHPPSARQDINLEAMTLREVGEWAELHGMKLLDILTL